MGGMNKMKTVAKSDWYIEHMLYARNIQHKALREIRYSPRPDLIILTAQKFFCLEEHKTAKTSPLKSK